jgi:hypothetical protein
LPILLKAFLQQPEAKELRIFFSVMVGADSMLSLIQSMNQLGKQPQG